MVTYWRGIGKRSGRAWKSSVGEMPKEDYILHEALPVIGS